MFRSTLLGSILAVCMAPLSVGINALVNSAPQASVAPESKQLSENLSLLSSTLVSFEQRQAGSEAALTEQLKSLASAVSQTQAANESQIENLSKSLEEVKRVAVQDDSEFKRLLSNFATNFEKRIDAKLVKAEVEDETPPVPESKGVGTLDVNAIPSESSDGIDSIQTMSDAARRIIALEKEVAALKARSTTSSVPATVQYQSYPTTVGTVVSGGSCGNSTQYSYSQSVPQSYYSQPQQQYYQQQTTYSQGTPVQRAPQQACKWRLVRGQWVCIK